MKRYGSKPPGSSLRSVLGLAVVMLWAVLASAQAAGPHGDAAAGRSAVLRDQTITSAVLGRSLAYSIYLPPGYGETARRFPVLFLLHGTDGDQDDWQDRAELRQHADRLLAEGRILPMLIVTPGGGNSWYVDNPDHGGEGNWEQAFMDELLPAIDRRYRTLPTRADRGIGGLSMGGYGAIRLAFAHPDQFAVVASLSGALFLPDQHLSAVDIIDLHGAFGAPFDRSRFEHLNVFALVPALAERAEPLAIYLASGDRDALNLDQNTALFYVALSRAGLVSTLHIRKGAHDWGFWSAELDRVLRFAGQHFAAPPQDGVETAAVACPDMGAGGEDCRPPAR